MGIIWVLGKDSTMSTATVEKPKNRAEIKTRTEPNIKASAADIYARWGITLNDAINMFLVKSIEVGGLPFDLRPEKPSYDAISTLSYKAKLNSEGVAVLPASWDDDDE
jgi:DNA-damage-inducible protein J